MAMMPMANPTMYRKTARTRCQARLRSSYWSCARVMASTNAAIAEDPDHRLIRKPAEMTPAGAALSTSWTVGVMISSSAWRLNSPPAISSTHSSTAVEVSGPNSPSTYPRVANNPSKRGGRDSACQNAAEAASLKMSSFHAFVSVRVSSRRAGPCRRPGAAVRRTTDRLACSATAPAWSA
jgi:hypothetical protein